jgi:uncharacterized protein involved in exopolysaccharide biosynthesis
MTTGTAPSWYLATENLLRDARTHWKLLLTLTLTGGLAGGATAIVLPSYYQSGGSFQADVPPQNSLSSGLAGFASQLTNLPIGGQTNSQFLGDLLTTDAVLGRVARDSFMLNAKMTSLPMIYGYGRDPARLSEYNTVRQLRKAIRLDVSIRTGVVSFALEARTPELAKVLAESTLAALNAANIDLRQERAGAEQRFTSERAAAARLELDSAENALASFYQRNRVVGGSPVLQMEEAKLKRSVDMGQQLYVQLRLQEEQAAVQAVRNTPAISVINPPLLPVRRSWPKRRLAVVLGMALGLVTGVAFIVRAGLRET